MRSSYEKNNYGSIFRALILCSKPKLVVECGVLEGYSLLYIAHALRFNYQTGIKSKFFAYDLWEDYEYKHGNYFVVKNMIYTQKLDKYVNLEKGNAFEVYKNFNDNSIDFLHIDISNTGEKLIKILKLWGNKISNNGMIAFEGGSYERDNVDWMKKFKCTSILDMLSNNEIVYKNWDIQIFPKFPSLTLLFPKRKLNE